MPFRLLLPRRIYEEMLAHAWSELPNECCGLLAGKLEGSVGQVVKLYRLVNAAASPKEYLSEGKSILAAELDKRRLGLEFLVVYHSHPTSEPLPSQKDLERNYYPDSIHIIISMMADPPLVRGWWLGENDYQEAEWEVVESG